MSIELEFLPPVERLAETWSRYGHRSRQMLRHHRYPLGLALDHILGVINMGDDRDTAVSELVGTWAALPERERVNGFAPELTTAITAVVDEASAARQGPRQQHPTTEDQRNP